MDEGPEAAAGAAFIKAQTVKGKHMRRQKGSPGEVLFRGAGHMPLIAFFGH